MNKVYVIGKINKPPVPTDEKSIYEMTVLCQDKSSGTQEITVRFKREENFKRILDFPKGSIIEIDGTLQTIKESNLITFYDYSIVMAYSITPVVINEKGKRFDNIAKFVKEGVI